MDTPDDLINDLTRDLKPVKPIASLAQRVSVLSIIGFTLTVGAVFALQRVRPDFSIVMADPDYVIDVLLLLFAAILSAMSAAVLAVPDTRLRAAVILPLVAAHLVWLFLILKSAYIALMLGAPHMSGMNNCATDLALLLILPLGMAVFKLMKASPIWHGLAGYTLSLSMVTFAATAMRFLCPNDTAAHLLFWHFLPAVGIAVFGFFLGWIVFRKQT